MITFMSERNSTRCSPFPFYNSGARYQTTDGIFTSMDPLCEKYYSVLLKMK